MCLPRSHARASALAMTIPSLPCRLPHAMACPAACGLRCSTHLHRAELRLGRLQALLSLLGGLDQEQVLLLQLAVDCQQLVGILRIGRACCWNLPPLEPARHMDRVMEARLSKPTGACRQTAALSGCT